MGPFGVQEMLAVFVLALLLFGPKKLPELGRMLGKAVSEFRRAKNELKSTFESHLSELEREAQADKYSDSSPNYSSVRYPYPYDETGHQESDYNSPPALQDTNEPHEASTLEPSTAGATQQDAETNPDTLVHDSPIGDTVPRSNGFQPSGSGSVATEEKNSAH